MHEKRPMKQRTTPAGKSQTAKVLTFLEHSCQ
jgi:hypothetical protein